MKILVAMNEFKGSLSSKELGSTIKKKISEKLSYSEVEYKIIADGGDGFLSIFEEFEEEYLKVENSLGEEVTAKYLINLEKKEAVIEVAEVIGLKKLKEDEKNPYKTSTAGLGVLIKHLLDKGVNSFIIGLGGSSTNDCGLGMLSELGCKFFDEGGELCRNGIDDLKRVIKIDDRDVDKRLITANFTIICDVENPLYGKNGATFVYSKQKGLSESDFEKVDKYICDFSKTVFNKLGKDCSAISGSGAAGGLGYAFLSFMNAKKLKGSEFVIEYLDLDKKLSEVDILITGEGKLDGQSFMGKAPIEVARVAKKYNKKVIFLAGSIFDTEVEQLSLKEQALLDASFSIQRGVCELEAAMDKKTALKNLERTVEQICSLLEFGYAKAE